MRRAIAAFLVVAGVLMVQGGKFLAALGALALSVVGVYSIVRGHIAGGIFVLFPCVPILAAGINIVVSVPGAVILESGLRLRGDAVYGDDVGLLSDLEA